MNKTISIILLSLLTACATDKGANQHECVQNGGCYRITETELTALKQTLHQYNLYIQQQEAKIKQLTSMLDKSCI